MPEIGWRSDSTVTKRSISIWASLSARGGQTPQTIALVNTFALGDGAEIGVSRGAGASAPLSKDPLEFVKFGSHLGMITVVEESQLIQGGRLHCSCHTRVGQAEAHQYCVLGLWEAPNQARNTKESAQP